MEIMEGEWEELCRCVMADPAVPDWVKKTLASTEDREAHAAIDVSATTTSYLEFLREQIELSPRGSEWNEVLQSRLNALERYVNVSLLRLSVRDECRGTFILRARLKSLEIIYWEVC